MNVLRQLQGFFWEKRSYLFLSMLCLAIATALGLVYPHLLKVLIDDAIKLENYGIVPRWHSLCWVWSSLKLSCSFARIFGGGWGTTWLTRYETPAMKNCNFYRSVTMIRLGPGI